MINSLNLTQYFVYMVLAGFVQHKKTIEKNYELKTEDIFIAFVSTLLYTNPTVHNVRTNHIFSLHNH